MVGSKQRVLVMGKSRKGDSQLAARTENNRALNFDGPQTLIGDSADVQITEASQFAAWADTCVTTKSTHSGVI